MANGSTELLDSRNPSLAEATNPSDRKSKIVAALYRCMAKKGYAATTLCDIAEEAGMTSSHLLYYYPGKESILEAFFIAVTKRLQVQIAELTDREPADKIEAIADLFLNAKSLYRVNLGVMLDLYGQSVQNKAMRRIKVAQDRRIKDMFVELFSQLSCAPDLTPDDAAHSACATLLGLRANSFYDAALSPALASRLFKQALLRLLA